MTTFPISFHFTDPLITVPLILAAKALELFLGLIIEQAHAVTADRGSKKVEVYHLCVQSYRLSFLVLTPQPSSILSFFLCV